MDDLQYFISILNPFITSFSFVLNLVINGWPSILELSMYLTKGKEVLNLVINGWPSIL